MWYSTHWSGAGDWVYEVSTEDLAGGFAFAHQTDWTNYQSYEPQSVSQRGSGLRDLRSAIWGSYSNSSSIALFPLFTLFVMLLLSRS